MRERRTGHHSQYSHSQSRAAVWGTEKSGQAPGHHALGHLAGTAGEKQSAQDWSPAGRAVLSSPRGRK